MYLSFYLSMKYSFIIGRPPGIFSFDKGAATHWTLGMTDSNKHQLLIAPQL